MYIFLIIVKIIINNYTYIYKAYIYAFVNKYIPDFNQSQNSRNSGKKLIIVEDKKFVDNENKLINKKKVSNINLIIK